jgi:hypothetical protein
VNNKDIAKKLVGDKSSGKGDEKSASAKDGGEVTDNAAPTGLSDAMQEIAKHLSNKDWEGAAQAFRDAHTIAAGDGGKDNDDSSEY